MKMFFWKGGLVGAIVESSGRESVQAAAERVLARANEHVPYRSGALESTGKVSTDGLEAAISYDTVYAARLHQHPEYNFQGKGRGRWLVEAIEMDRANILESMAGPYRNALGQFAVRPH
jgi:hypothetical protein